MAQVRVRPVQDEQVREPRHRDSQVRSGAFLPDLVQVEPVPSVDVQRRQEFGRVEARTEDDRVDVDLRAGGRHQTGRSDLLDTVRHHVGVGSQQRRVPVVRDQDATTPGRVLRDQRLTGQAGLHHRSELVSELLLQHGPHAAAPPHQHEPCFETPVDRLPVEPLQRTHVLQQPVLPGAERTIRLRCHVVHAALEQRQLAGVGRHLWHELDGTRSDADHGDTLTAQVVVVVPTGRVEHGPPERLETGDVGDVRSVELPQAAHHDLGIDDVGHVVAVRPGVDGQVPQRLVVVPGGCGDGGVEPQVRTQFEPVDQRFEVAQDLGLLGELPGPVGLRSEGEAVQV